MRYTVYAKNLWDRTWQLEKTTNYFVVALFWQIYSVFNFGLVQMTAENLTYGRYGGTY